jgi:hypothetical protein
MCAVNDSIIIVLKHEDRSYAGLTIKMRKIKMKTILKSKKEKPAVPPVPPAVSTEYEKNR